MPVRWGVHQIPQINLDLNLSRCRVALRPAVLSAARIWPGVSRYLEVSFGLRGPSPQAFTSFGRVGELPGAWGAPNQGNADGAVGIFGKCRARVGYGPAPGPTIKKALCHTFPLGGASNKYRKSISVLSEQYEICYLFYVTLSFLCNIICYLISVFVFSLVTLSGATTKTDTKIFFLEKKEYIWDF